MRRLVAFGALAVALTACGSPQPAANQSTIGVEPTSESAPAAPTAAVPPSVSSSSAEAVPVSGKCTAAVLAGGIETTDAGAGNRYGKLVVTNNGEAPCTLNGYSGLQLLDAAGQPVPTDLRRVNDPGPSRVLLPPRAKAVANLHWTVVPTGDEPVERPCQPEATQAVAIPPDDTQPMSLNWGLGPVCGGGKIEISAFYAA